MSIEIRKADLSNPDVATAWIGLLDHYARDPMGGGEGLAEEVKAVLPERVMARQGNLVLLAWDNDQAVGVLDAFEGFSTFKARPLLNIHDVAVHKDWRGQGIARLLLQAAENEAKARGCCKLTLEVLSNNQVARQAYLNFGFQAYELDAAAGTAEFWEKHLT